MRDFGMTTDGQRVWAMELKNGKGMEVTILTYGAIIQSIRVPDRTGKTVDVALGYDTVSEYQENSCFFGPVVGRNANRIADAKVCINGITYELEANDNGKNSLHSGSKGIQKKVWTVEEETESSVTLSVESPHLEDGFPGNMKIRITYTVTESNELVLSYQAETDMDTVCNLTNHCYFNLSGHESGDVLGQQIALFADTYTPVADPCSIPTGELAEVDDTPMDLRVMKTIGESIDADFDQLNYAGGYDHNWVVEGEDGLGLIARAKSSVTGIVMETETDLPGVQFYTGNYIPDHRGKNGATYHRRQGFCLETQYFPNAVNEENFASPLLKAGDTYRTKTVYRFFVEE